MVLEYMSYSCIYRGRGFLKSALKRFQVNLDTSLKINIQLHLLYNDDAIMLLQ